MENFPVYNGFAVEVDMNPRMRRKPLRRLPGSCELTFHDTLEVAS